MKRENLPNPSNSEDYEFCKEVENLQKAWEVYIKNWASAIKGGLMQVANVEAELFDHYFQARELGKARYLHPSWETVIAARDAAYSEPWLGTELRPIKGGGLELEIVVEPGYTEEQLDALEELDLKDYFDTRKGDINVWSESGVRVELDEGEGIPIDIKLRETRAIIPLPENITIEETVYIAVYRVKEGPSGKFYDQGIFTRVGGGEHGEIP